MVNGDLSQVKKKKPKVAVSLSLDKENVEFLKEDMKRFGEELTLSSVFDFLLEDFVKAIKKQKELDETHQKERG